MKAIKSAEKVKVKVTEVNVEQTREKVKQTKEKQNSSSEFPCPKNPHCWYQRQVKDWRVSPREQWQSFSVA
jgi:hypothetical protein